MGFKDPIRAPGSYNKFRLVPKEGGSPMFSPGTITEAKLGSRVVEIQDQQQPGFAGAVVVQRLEKIWTGAYKYRVWTTAEHTSDREFVRKLRAGQKKGAAPTGVLGSGRRAQVWRLSDPRLMELDVVEVLVEEIGAIEIGGPGKPYYREIKFHEYKKPIQLPLLKVEPNAADKEFERQVAASEAERKSLEAELAKLKRAG